MDEWTPEIGWKTAIKRIAVGALIGAIASAAGFAGLYSWWWYGSVLIKLIVLSAMGIGFIQGWIITKDLVNQTGIEAKSLMWVVVPVLVVVSAILLAGCWLADFDSRIPCLYFPLAALTGCATAVVRLHLE